MPRYRNRSTSYGSFHDHHPGATTTAAAAATTATMEDIQTAKGMMNAIISLPDASGRSFLHTRCNLTMAKAMLDRAKALDEMDGNNTNDVTKSWQRKCLLQADRESWYTPFHSAIMDRNLAAILLFLRHATDAHSTDRFTQSPMTVLHTLTSTAASTTATVTTTGNHLRNDLLIQEMVTAVDKEGFTPLELLGRIQQKELAQCRKRLMPKTNVLLSSSTRRLRPRQSSFDDGQHQAHEELDFLTDHMDLLDASEEDDETANDECTYACEVVTFGRANHCALGVVSSSNNEGSSSVLRPQRVQEFAQDSIGRDGSAVAVAAATHHTLVATKNGHLYAFGLGKGGRLGLGDDQVQQCPLPRRVKGPLARHKVVGIAAAENHSLCVTSSGALFAWGSNRFGQLGSVETKASELSSSSSKGANKNNFRCLPRRVEDLRNIPCVAVAAGEKHSVALSRRGEIYVWGDNTAGQLGVPRRSGIQKVQRVEALWKADKCAIAISAAEQSTLVLTSPVPGLSQVNSVYSWGHGNYVPSRVYFGKDASARNGEDQKPLSSMAQRVVNPVGIACARYHNTAITSDGHVYTWGLHAESLGRSSKQQNPNSSSSGLPTSSPQLVNGMLPENGGGVAVAISASDQHTAVVTDCGALYTWGATYGNNALGHEGVRYQPSPKRVAGIHRAVNVAVAKEHTVLLLGSSFPRIPTEAGLESLEELASKKVAEHVDLFNVIPILIMAERTECFSLIEYCAEFIHRNLDGVMNVGKKTILNQYLNDMLADSMHRPGKRYRDDHHHPFVTDVITAGNTERPSFDRGWLSSMEEWIAGCNELSCQPIVKNLLLSLSATRQGEDNFTLGGRRRQSSFAAADSIVPADRNSSLSTTDKSNEEDGPLSSLQASEGVLDRCIKRTSNMDLSSSEGAKKNSTWLAKEIRGVRKKLSQIKKLQDWESIEATVLSTEQRAKVNRRSTLEAELCIYESALEEVETKIKELAIEEDKKRKESHLAESTGQVAHEARMEKRDTDGDKCNDEVKKMARSSGDEVKGKGKALFCVVCGIKCPDQRSFELHKSGRKHRNRVAQAAEAEKANVATAIMERQNLDQVKGPGSVRQNPSTPTLSKTVWGVPSAQPKFTLPPPPHPTVPPVPSPRLSWTTNGRSQHQPKLVAPAKAVPSNRFAGKNDGNQASATTPKSSLESAGSPVWNSAQGSSYCVPLQVNSSSASSLPVANTRETHSSSISLADFLTPKPTLPKKSGGGKSWSNPPTKTTPSPKSLAQIQAEETTFLARQDKVYGKGGGTWFIERRERADSLLEIQDSAAKEQEEREFIEEQKQIEEQIQKELAQQKRQKQGARGKAKQKKGNPSKKNPGKSPKPSADINLPSTGKQDNAAATTMDEAPATVRSTAKKRNAKSGRQGRRSVKNLPAGHNNPKRGQEQSA